MTEHDRTHRERTLTSESSTSDKGRPKSFTESDKNVEKISIKRPAQDTQAASEDNSNTEKKVVLVGESPITVATSC